MSAEVYLAGKVVEDIFDGVTKAHLQQVVSLVKNEGMQISGVESQFTVLQQVKQPEKEQ